MTEPLVSVRNLTKYFWENNSLLDRALGDDPVAVKAVDGVSFDIFPGETLGLVGESGCGKSTCGETILGLQEATDGTVRFDGQEVFSLSKAERKSFYRSAQVVFQDPFSSLDPRQTIGETVEQPLEVHDWPTHDPEISTETVLTTDGISPDNVSVSVADDIDRVVAPEDGTATVHVTVERTRAAQVADDGTAEDRTVATVDTNDSGEDGLRVTVAEDLTVSATSEGGTITVDITVGRSDGKLRTERVRTLLERVGLSADQFDRYPHEFSGGQRQRIGIARALALEPEFLVLDEPTSALDVSVQAQILNLLSELQADLDLTYLLISHDLSVIRHISDRVAVMYLGELVEVGPSEEIFTDPQHPYTEALLESVPRASVSERDREVKTLSGDVPSPRNPPSGCRFRTRCPKVIQPPDLEMDQAAYRAVMTVRQKIAQREIDIDGAWVRVADGPPSDQESRFRVGGGDSEAYREEHGPAVVDYLEAQLTSVELPPRHQERVRDALEQLLTRDWEAAEQLLDETYQSICERESPRRQRERDHSAACHLLDEPRDGDRRLDSSEESGPGD